MTSEVEKKAKTAVGELSHNFQVALKALHDEVDQRWASKANNFVMEVAQISAGEEQLFPTKDEYKDVGQKVHEFMRSLPASTQKAYASWLYDGEFPIFYHQNAYPNLTEMILFSNFARQLEINRDQANMWSGRCFIWYKDEETPQHAHCLTPKLPRKRPIAREDDKAFPLTSQQCKVLSTLQGKHKGPRTGNVDKEIEELQDQMIMLFREKTHQPLLYQTIREKKKAEDLDEKNAVTIKQLDRVRDELEGDRKKLEADRKHFAERVARLAEKEKKQQEEQSGQKNATVVKILADALNEPMPETAAYAIKEAIGLIEGCYKDGA